MVGETFIQEETWSNEVTVSEDKDSAGAGQSKQNKEYMNMLNKSMTEAAAGDVVVKSLDELRECE